MAVTIRLRALAIVLATIPVTKAVAMALAIVPVTKAAAMALAMTAATGRTMGRRIPPRMIMATVLLEPIRRMGPMAYRVAERTHTMAPRARRVVHINPK